MPELGKTEEGRAKDMNLYVTTQSRNWIGFRQTVWEPREFTPASQDDSSKNGPEISPVDEAGRSLSLLSGS